MYVTGPMQGPMNVNGNGGGMGRPMVGGGPGGQQQRGGRPPNNSNNGGGGGRYLSNGSDGMG